MALFNLGSSSGKIKGAKEAYFSVIFAAMAADGRIDDEEVNSLLHIVSNKKVFRNVDLSKTYKKVMDLFTDAGSAGMVKVAAPILNKEQKKTAYVTAVDFLLTDGVIGKDEEKFLNAMTEAFKYDKELERKIVDVIMWKNREL